MSDAIKLQLLAGPAVPLPVPRAVVESLQEVKVESGSGATQSGFELTFEVSNRSPLQTLFLLAGGASIPILRVVIVLTVRGCTSVLMDGVMTHHELRSSGPGTSTLSVKGKDLTAVMDIIPLDGLPYPAMPPALRVLTALAKYAALGIAPMVIPSVFEDIPIPIERIPRHQGTDRGYIASLAEAVGYVFYIDPGPLPGSSRAYWGPELRMGTPQKALSAGLPEPYANATNLQFRFDKEAKELPIVFIQEPNSKVPIPIPIPDMSPLSPPLGLVPPLPPKLTFLNDTAKLNPIAAVMSGLAYSAQHGDSVFGSGTLDVVRYGGVLRSRRLVTVRGAGEAFDGLHYVKSVTSTLKRGEFAQSFELARNALISTLPTVPS
jgi:hypothetical protein